MENAIVVKDLYISYKSIHVRYIKKGLFNYRKGHRKTHSVIKGISFNVLKGETIGIIGENGSGKSTLLKAIGGIFKPDSGTINLNGNSVSLLSLGVGFQNNLSGRENIILSGMLLGFSEKSIINKMDEIIKFSGLKKCIDDPIKTYSSGMHSKLSFSITSILETDIILIDEIFSVGDAAFKKKSRKKFAV